MNRKPARFQNGSLTLVKNKAADDSWFFRYYEVVGGKRVHRNLKIGTAQKYPRRRDAEKAVLQLRSQINSEIRSPQTVNDLVAHYLKHELNLQKKAFATVDAHEAYLRLHIQPRWGTHNLSEVRTVLFEEWLESLPFAPATKTKLRNIMSAVYSHGIRYEWITFNPISKVRCSAKRLREPDVLTPAEFLALFRELELREQVMVLLAVSTGLSRSEFIGLRWKNVDLLTMEVAVLQSCVRNRFGDVKTESRGVPVAIHPPLDELLTKWRDATNYKEEEDFLFPSVRLNGNKPASPDMVLKKILRPALVRAGVFGKVIGWHSFRHSYATNLAWLGTDVKTAQALMRHANSRTTMDIYTHAVTSAKRTASRKNMEALMAGGA